MDYFPAYQPTVRVTRSDGAQEETDQYLVVANFGYLRSCWGVVPYEIWLKAPNGVEAVSQYAAESGNRYLKFTDIDTQISDMKHSPSIQGTNGILTLSFIIGLTLCAAGFLIFWILSIRSRSLQFGIYPAMGMSVGELIALLINEHLWQSVISMAAGAGIGVLVSRLYIPLIQLAYSSADATLPCRSIEILPITSGSSPLSWGCWWCASAFWWPSFAGCAWRRPSNWGRIDMLKTIDVSRAFPIQGEEDFYALKKVNVHIEKGKLTVLVGKSGSGKTTLMNILGALDPPTEGKVLFEGRTSPNCRRRSAAACAGRRWAMCSSPWR